jgi:branched-chain amino acid transport system substrate-binding protein
MRAELRGKLVLAALALTLLSVAAGCGAARDKPIRIGVLTDCGGPFGFAYQSTLAGAELPLIERGGKLRGPGLAGGVKAASVAGKPVELLIGCEGGTFATMLAAARRLVERQGAQILVGPLAELDGFVLRQYAMREPGVVFSIAAALGPETTLLNPAANVFRFNLDGAQWMAGLGAYAYRQLGWRSAAMIGEDDPYGWQQAAGFVAEFCALGGNIVKRLWAPFYSPTLTPLIAQLPRRVDGVALLTVSENTAGFFSAYGELYPDLARRLVASGPAILLSALTNRMLGVVGAWSVPSTSRARGWTGYLAAFRKAFPGAQGGGIFDLSYYDAMEPVLRALEQVHGDLSGGERQLMKALGAIQFDAPTGRIRLDANRQAIGSNFLIQVQRVPAGKVVVRTLKVIPNVEQTFNGYFGAGTPAASRTQPACRHGRAPAWTRSG